MTKNSIHSKLITLALAEAAKSTGEVPVGALIVFNGEIIARASNQKEKLNDVAAHAEMLVIKEASRRLNNWRLKDTALYVTLEPCPMCAAAILYSRIPKIYFGSYDTLYGAFGSAIDMTQLIKFKPEIIGGIEEEKCRKVLKDFFEEKR